MVAGVAEGLAETPQPSDTTIDKVPKAGLAVAVGEEGWAEAEEAAEGVVVVTGDFGCAATFLPGAVPIGDVALHAMAIIDQFQTQAFGRVLL